MNPKGIVAALCVVAAAVVAPVATAAEPDYRTIRMEIDVARPAKEVWAKVGKYCDIAEWLKLDCKITAGDGSSIGTVRALAGGRVLEILVAQTELSYGYTQPVQEGRPYDLYHGFMEARPTGTNSSKIIYTLFYDASNLADAAAKDADVARRRAAFEKALQEMKRIAEAG